MPSSTLLLLFEAIQCNNEAVFRMEVGKWKEAAELLCHAMSALRQVVNTDLASIKEKGHDGAKMEADHHEESSSFSSSSSTASSRGNDDDEDVSMTSLDEEDSVSVVSATFEGPSSLQQGFHTVPVLVDSRLPQQQQDNGGDGDADAYHYTSLIYNQVFWIHSGETRTDLICGVIFYNFAMIHHCHHRRCRRNNLNNKPSVSRANQQDEHDSSSYYLSLRKALSCYKKAAVVAQALPLFDDEHVHLLHLALYNNIIQIHVTLEDRPAVHNMLTFLNLLVDGRPAFDDNGDDDDDDAYEDPYAFFVCNAFYYVADLTRCAPAA